MTFSKTIYYMIALAVAVLTPAATAYADLIAADWKRPGDHQITSDTATGLDWLNLTQSLDSYDHVIGEFGPTGKFPGFRYATEAEVLKLWADAGIPDTSGAPNPANYTPILQLLALIGVTRDEPGCCGGFNNQEEFHLIGSFGTTGTEPPCCETGPTKHVVGTLDTLAFAIAPNIGIARTSFALEDSGRAGGNYLVRATPPCQGDEEGERDCDSRHIPEPATFLLVVAGLAGLTGVPWRRRRR